MAEEFNFLWPKIENYIAEADADLIPVQGQIELHSRCRCGVLLSPCFGALFVADLILGVEKLELHYRCRGKSNFRKIRIATISVRMVVKTNESPKNGVHEPSSGLFSPEVRELFFRAETKGHVFTGCTMLKMWVKIWWQQNTTAGSLNHLVSWGKFTGYLHR